MKWIKEQLFDNLTTSRHRVFMFPKGNYCFGIFQHFCEFHGNLLFLQLNAVKRPGMRMDRTLDRSPAQCRATYGGRQVFTLIHHTVLLLDLRFEVNCKKNSGTHQKNIQTPHRQSVFFSEETKCQCQRSQWKSKKTFTAVCSSNRTTFGSDVFQLTN